MRITVTAMELVVDLVDTVTEIGDLTKLGYQLGFEMHVEPAWREGGTPTQVRFTRGDGIETWGSSELVGLASLVAYVESRSGNQIVETVRDGLDRRHYPMERPLQDVMDIGGGPDHPGHDR